MIKDTQHYELYMNGKMIKAFQTYEDAMLAAKRHYDRYPDAKHEVYRADITRKCVFIASPKEELWEYRPPLFS